MVTAWHHQHNDGLTLASQDSVTSPSPKAYKPLIPSAFLNVMRGLQMQTSLWKGCHLECLNPMYLRISTNGKGMAAVSVQVLQEAEAKMELEVQEIYWGT